VQNVVLKGEGNYCDGQPHAMFASRQIGTGKMEILVDGVSRGTADGRSNSLVCSTDLFVGSLNGHHGSWVGDLFEVFAFDRTLDALEHSLIENYLAGSYGTTPGHRLFFALETHGGDVAGIGRESSTSFIDAAEGTGILQLSNPSALSDGDYLLWGTDRPDDFTLSPDVPPPFGARLTRTWTTTLTDGGNGDGVGTVDVRFRVKGLFLSSIPRDFALLLDDDGDFSDARVNPVLGDFDSQGAIRFAQVELGPERFFTLAVKPL
jgi:hypothetical protein